MFTWLVVGVGDIAKRRVIPAILAEPRSRLQALVTPHPDKADSYGVPVWTELDAALADPGIDAVYVGTPVFLHAPQTVASLRAHKHVLCEKPMALNYPEACDMQFEAERVQKLLGVAYYRRCFPKLLRARQLLEEGIIGTPVLAEANCHSWFPPHGGPRTWLFDPALAGGGPLYDIASHRIDVMNFLFGKPVRASGHLANLVHQSAVEDCATVLIEYDSGVRGVVDVRWHSKVPRDDFRILGTDGELRLSPLSGPALEWPGGRDELPPHDNVHYPLIAAFVDGGLDGKPLATAGSAALWTDWVTQQVVQQNPRAMHSLGN
jgi:1,5-anhydro-D-fructose reductase (1,5-anhydro-D-mannitol-forming)